MNKRRFRSSWVLVEFIAPENLNCRSLGFARDDGFVVSFENIVVG